MSTAAALALAVAVAVAAINLHYSLLAASIHRLREGVWPALLPLGIPLLGSLAVVLAWVWGPSGRGWQGVLLALLLLDTGGPLACLLYWRRRWRQRIRRVAVPVAANRRPRWNSSRLP